jgi:hypothetical protein
MSHDSFGQSRDPTNNVTSTPFGTNDNRVALQDGNWQPGHGRYGLSLAEKTQEQIRRDHISSVVGEISKGAKIYSFEKEKKEEIKFAMLSEIDSLMSSLEEDGIDLSRIEAVDKNSTYEDIEATFKILRHKNDRHRYCNFAEECLLVGAYGLEEVFDGNRLWLGHRPDLRGWHNDVNAKLRRMRHDTSTFVSKVMDDFNIGPGLRILMELVPSLLKYSKMHKEQYGSSMVQGGRRQQREDDEELRRATNRIRDIGNNLVNNTRSE